MKLNRTRIKYVVTPELAIIFVMILAFVERLLTLKSLGVHYTGYGDSINYYESALYYLQSGTIGYITPYPTAQIMPGIVILMGLFIKLFGAQFWQFGVAMRIFYYFLASLSAYFTYKAVSVFVSKWYGVLASTAFLLPNMAWASNSLGTEAPYVLFFIMTLYYTFELGNSLCLKNVLLYVFSFMMAFMFRANILIMLLATPLYLVICSKIPIAHLRRLFLILFSSLLLFIIPWTIRNYVHFDAVIPISYGNGNPMLLGTYYGDGSLPENDPTTIELADEIFYQRFSKYFNDDGEITDPKYEQFLALSHDKIEANIRIKEWLNRDVFSFFKYYLLFKPRLLLNWVWYWDSVFDVPYSVLHYLSIVNMLVCAFGLVLSFVSKKQRAIMVFLSILYIVSVYSCAIAFVSDRYASLFMPIRYIMFGISVQIILQYINSVLSHINNKPGQIFQ